MEEEWKEIEGYEGLYQISSFGRVKSLKCGRQKILKLGSNPLGYSVVGLYKNRQEKYLTVHRIVAKAFIPNQENKKEVNHIDGNKKNNNINNLEWVTRSENIKHAVRIGLLKTKGFIRKKRRVIQKDLDGNIIKIWDSCSSIVKEKGYSDSHICACCNKSKNRKTAYGYIWEYEKELGDRKSN